MRAVLKAVLKISAGLGLAVAVLFAQSLFAPSPVAAQSPPASSGSGAPGLNAPGLNAPGLNTDIPAPVPYQPAQKKGLAEASSDDDTIAKQSALLHFATRYTEIMVLGLLTGGLTMNALIGGLPATLAGTAVGAIIASWFYFDQASELYIIKSIH